MWVCLSLGDRFGVRCAHQEEMVNTPLDIVAQHVVSISAPGATTRTAMPQHATADGTTFD